MRAAFAAFVVAFTVLGLGAAPASLAFHDGTSSCTYSAGVVRLRLASQHVVQLLAVEGRIEYADLTDYSFRGQCGSATVSNTDTVRLSETVAGTTRFQLRQQFGRLGPGRTRETTGVSEIEVYLGTVTDIWLLGRPVRDAVTVGAGGLNLNGDGDVDLIGSHVAEITAFLEEGNDLLTAEGGRGTGSPWFPPAGGYLSAYGGDGADLLRGSGGNDTLDGDWDDDRVYGLGGRDDLRGSTGHDFVSGGSGADYIDPGYGYDTVFAGPGNDFIAAADYTADTIDGGNGSDSAFADREDQVTNVESVSPGP
jgi:Ca2+-binding RTX toxin-like protein